MYIFAFLAGVLTTLSPCVLPLIPIVMGTALQADRWAPVALAIGFTASFAIIGVALTALGLAFGIDPRYFRMGAALVMGGFGLVLLIPVLYVRFNSALTGVASRVGTAAGEVQPIGRLGHLGLGVLLSVVWSPCAGPTLGAAIGMAGQTGQLASAAALMTVFSIGSAVPLLALSYGSRKALLGRRAYMQKIAQVAKPVFGVILVTVALYSVSGADRYVESWLARHMPTALIDLTTKY